MNALSSMILPLALLAGSVTPASAAPAKEARLVADEMQAQVTAVDLEKKTFSVKQEGGSDLSLSFDERTQFVLDGEKSSAERVLAVGKTVTVAHANGKAGKVSGRSKALLAADDMRAQISAVDLEKSTFSVKLEGREVSLSYDERTQFLLDGEKSSAERVLAVGRTVNVAHANGKASKVEAKSQG